MSTADTCTLNLITGKTWVRSFQRKTDGGVIIPFLETDTLRTRVFESAGGESILEIPTIITNHATGSWKMLLSNEQSSRFPTNQSFTVARVLYFNTDVIAEDLTETSLISNGQIQAVTGIIGG